MNWIFLDIFKPEIAFDGWAVAIIILVLSCLGVGTYKYITRNKISQNQKSGLSSEQDQSVSSTSMKDKNVISQSQKAGNNSKQKQTI